MFIPHSMGQLTGWKAVVAGVVIVGVIGLGVWSKMQPHQLDKGRLNVEVSHYAGKVYSGTSSARIKVEITPQGPVESYMVLVLDDATAPRLATDDPDTLPKIASQTGSGPITLGPVSLGSGRYHIDVLNLGKKPIVVDYVVTQLP